MPKRFIKLSRSEPSRVILVLIALIFLVSQVFTLTPWYTHPDLPGVGPTSGDHPPFYQKAPNAFLFGSVCVYGAWSGYKNDLKHMSWSSMMMFALFFLAALTRAIFAPDPSNLLWLGYFALSVVMAVIHIFVEGLRKGGVLV